MGCGGSKVQEEIKPVEIKKIDTKKIEREQNMIRYNELKVKIDNYVKETGWESYYMITPLEEWDKNTETLTKTGWKKEDFIEGGNNHKFSFELKVEDGIEMLSTIKETLKGLPNYKLNEKQLKKLNGIGEGAKKGVFLEISDESLANIDQILINLKYDVNLDLPVLGFFFKANSREAVKHLAEFFTYSKNLDTAFFPIGFSGTTQYSVDDFLPLLKAVARNKNIKHFAFGGIEKDIKLSLNEEGQKYLAQIAKNVVTFAFGKIEYSIKGYDLIMKNIAANTKLRAFAIDSYFEKQHYDMFIETIKLNKSLVAAAFLGYKDWDLTKPKIEEASEANPSLQLVIVDMNIDM